MIKPTLFLAGHRGMVGRAIARQLQAERPAHHQPELLTASRAELDLLNQQAVNAFFQQHKIDQVIIAAAKVGGIQANNSLPAEFIYQNLMIEANLIHAAHQADIQQLLFLGSSCIYPRDAPQPMAEDALLTGPLEPTNEPYAIAPNVNSPPASSCARVTTANTGATTAASCRPTSTAPATTFTPSTAM
ncbi:GDP-L-fucose synthase [Thiorhodovibrio winogradskyi]|uniref:GDP-L-fucose synthase n=1 Tax=Thiorhodovibrio winogradskyi TaxID=77007 RepID=A0ABZ0S4R1_9GAMM